MSLAPLSDPVWISRRVFEAKALAEKYRQRSVASQIPSERVRARELQEFWTETADALAEREHQCRLAINAGTAA